MIRILQGATFRIKGALCSPNSLPRCIKCLGWAQGWRYWRLSRRAAKDPGLVPRWAQDCREAAKETSDLVERAFLLSWATALDNCWHDYLSSRPTTVEFPTRK